MDKRERVVQALAPKKAQVKRRAKGFIKHDYLVPAGPYEEQWDWDGFFIGVALASEISSEAIYLKNWALNYLEHVQKNGFTPGLLTPKGIDKRLKHSKPFLAQGVYLASNWLDDFSWVAPHWSRLKMSVAYREKIYFDRSTGLAAWHDSMESGADNNVAVLGYKNGNVLAVDLNTFLYQEYRALAQIAKKLGKAGDAKRFIKKSQNIRKAILKYLWDSKSQSFYNVDISTDEHIKKCTYSNFVALSAGIASRKQGREMIKRYLLNPKKMWSRYGLRTLAADEVEYNNRNIIKPHSNWQGPIWPIANYFYIQALVSYGFTKEAKQVIEKTYQLILSDIQKTGGMHENYHADTGRPLAAPDFISWNLLVGQFHTLVE